MTWTRQSLPWRLELLGPWGTVGQSPTLNSTHRGGEVQRQGRALEMSCSQQPSCMDLRAKPRRVKRCETGLLRVLCVVASAQFWPPRRGWGLPRRVTDGGGAKRVWLGLSVSPRQALPPSSSPRFYTARDCFPPRLKRTEVVLFSLSLDVGTGCHCLGVLGVLCNLSDSWPSPLQDPFSVASLWRF